MIDLIILGLLLDTELHGYQLKQKADKFLAGFYEVSYGTLYPKFKKLEAQEYIKSRSSVTNGGQERIFYNITKPGRDYFNLLMEEIPKETFPLQWLRFKIKLLFFSHIDKDFSQRLIDQMKKALEQEIDSIELILETENGFDEVRLSLLNHSLGNLKNNLVWIQLLRH